MKYIPTQADCDALKAAAAREARLAPGMVLLEPGLRFGPIKTHAHHMNIALVSDDPQWNDTDLADYGTWSDFRKGLELTEDGRGTVDFYLRTRFDPHGELHGNVSCTIVAGHLAEIHDAGGKVLWSRAV